jgi:CHAT domain-containing protein/Tfp pilus assembly protein PilF
MRFRILMVLGVALLGATTLAAQKSADDVLARAREIYVEEGPNEALPVYEQALALYREAGDRLGEAITLGYIGNCSKRQGDYDRALEQLGRALAMKRELGDRLEEGKTLSHLGLVYWELADYPQAIGHFELAIAIGRELDHAQLEGSGLNNLSLVYDELGDYDRSLEQYRQALELYRETDFPRGESDTLGNIGGVYLLLGRYREAMGYYEQALAISERLEAKPSMSLDLGNLALCHLGLGEISEAMERFDRAMTLAVEAGLERDRADWLKGKGELLLEVGRYGEGMELVGEALAIYESAGLDRERIEALADLGSLHLLLGDAQTAESYLRESLATSRTIGHDRGVTTNLLALGDLEWHRQRYELAAANYLEAIEGATEAGDVGGLTTGHLQLAYTYRDQERLGAARGEAMAGLELAEAEGVLMQIAEARFALGDIERLAGTAEKALAQFEAGERLIEDLGEPEIAWRLAHGRGRALEMLERDEEAVDAYKHAVDLIETVRARLRQDRFRAGYIEDKHEVYTDLARLLVRLGREAEAFRYSEKLRARAYLEMLSRGRTPLLTSDQLRREVELRQRVRRLEAELELERIEPRDYQRRQAIELFSTQLAAAERDYANFLSDLRQIDPRLASSWSLAVPEEAAVRAALPPGVLLVEFLVTGDDVLLFAMNREAMRTFTVPLGERSLEARVELLRDLVLRPGDPGWSGPAAGLGEALIAPLREGGLLEAADRLFLVPHGVLHYLPFAALLLGEPERPLVASHDLVYLPSAAHLVYAAPNGAEGGGLLAMAPARARLRWAEEEARVVSAALPGEHRLLVGDEATEAAFKQGAGDFGRLHLATHSTWNRLNPMLTALELEPGDGEDGRLEVHEILGLDLPADLVTLSACETALGSGYFAEVPAGDDFVGLTRAFLHAGSSAVLASLWEVDDRSTLEVMRDLYARLADARPSAALAAAQRDLLGRGELAHPYHWAPFVLVGLDGVGNETKRPASVSVGGQ